MAGTVGSATWGVAKAVRLHSVRVLDCNGNGSYSGVIGGIDWVTGYHVAPAVANMSLGGSANQALDDAVRGSIRSGVVYSVAAGNWNDDACNYSPPRTREAITVGAIDSNDARAYFSDYGSCVDIFAPGVNITSTWNNGGTNTISGTSMATPHVTGVAALMLEYQPFGTPAWVANAIMGSATMDRISNAASANHLHYSSIPTSSGRTAYFRYGNTTTGAHLYTVQWSELGGAGFGGWVYEGGGVYVMPYQAAGTIPMYRYRNTSNGDYFLTIYWSELGAGGGDWIYEGVNAYVPSAASSETANFYRYVNTTHFYTMYWSELGGGGGGWVYEGVCCQVYPQP